MADTFLLWLKRTSEKDKGVHGKGVMANLPGSLWVLPALSLERKHLSPLSYDPHVSFPHKQIHLSPLALTPSAFHDPPLQFQMSHGKLCTLPLSFDPLRPFCTFP